MFRLWLLTKKRAGEPIISIEDLPKKVCGSRAYLKKGLYIPYPSGPHWERIRSEPNYRRKAIETLTVDEEEEEELFQAMRAYRKAVEYQAKEPRPLAMLCKAMLCRQARERLSWHRSRGFQLPLARAASEDWCEWEGCASRPSPCWPHGLVLLPWPSSVRSAPQGIPSSRHHSSPEISTAPLAHATANKLTCQDRQVYLENHTAS